MFRPRFSLVNTESSAHCYSVRDMRMTPPFPLGDRLELWLLNASNLRPLALLSTALSKLRHKEIHRAEWSPLRTHEQTITASATPGAETQELHEAMHRLVNKTVGKPARAQWFERDEDGAGSGLDGICIDPALVDRRLPPSEFPELPMSECWEDEEQRCMVLEYHAWQAPLLLMLPQLTQTTRERLEQAAIDQPMTVHSVYRLYPKIIQQTLINKALVEAEFRRAATLVSKPEQQIRFGNPVVAMAW